MIDGERESRRHRGFAPAHARAARELGHGAVLVVAARRTATICSR